MYLIVQALTGLLASFIIGLVLEWRLALVMVATFPLLTVGAIYENIVLRGFSDETAKAQESASQVRGFFYFRLVVFDVRLAGWLSQTRMSEGPSHQHR
jgi:ABC-type multidrug transport system fused ATPase/permease subunit